MKRYRYALFFLIPALLSVFFLRSGERQSGGPRLWLGGLELTEGGCFEVGGGTAEYLPDESLLILRSVTVSESFRGSALYCDDDLTLLLNGASSLSGSQNGITVLGSLSVGGEGSLFAEGSRGGAAVRGSLLLFDSASLLFRSDGRPLRWAELRCSTLNRVEEADGTLRVYAPLRLTLQDGELDVAGHALRGVPYYDRVSVRRGDPYPEPETPLREGYRFEGWFADRALTEPFDFSRSCTEDTALYAAWNQLITVRFDSWGGTPIPDSVTVWGQAASTPQTPERKGFRFTGWFCDEALTVPYFPHEPQTEDHTVFAGWEKLASAILKGVDVSRYQGEIDWPLVAAEEDFVFIRLGFRGYGETGSLNIDDLFEANLSAASAAGIPVGVYFFSQAATEEEAVEEARFCLEALDGRELPLPVVIDYELATNADGTMVGRLYEAKLSGEEHGRICAAFCREIEKNGYTAAVYAGKQLLENGLGEVLEHEGCPVWLANWTVQTRYRGDYFCWQYSDRGSCPGISGPVDRSLWYVPLPQPELAVSVNDAKGSVSWERVPGARGYILFRKAPGETEFSELVRLNGAARTDYTDEEYRSGSEYAVKAYITLGSGDYIIH